MLQCQAGRRRPRSSGEPRRGRAFNLLIESPAGGQRSATHQAPSVRQPATRLECFPPVRRRSSGDLTIRGTRLPGPRGQVLLEEHAVPGSALTKLLALGHRLRCRRAHDEAPPVPVHVVLSEVAVEHAPPDPGGPHVDRSGRRRARRGARCGWPRAPRRRSGGRGRSRERARRSASDDHAPVLLESGRRRPRMRFADPTKSATNVLRGRSY